MFKAVGKTGESVLLLVKDKILTTNTGEFEL